MPHLKFNPKQERLLESQAKLFWLAGGVGSGKTFCGSAWAIRQAINYPKILGFIGSNTYRQLSQSTLPPFFWLCRYLGIDYIYGKRPPVSWNVKSKYEDHTGVITLINGAQIVTYSLENYFAIRGIQVGWAWLDETADTNPDAVRVLFERLRGFDGIYPDYKYLVRITGTPNGFDHLWEWFAGPKKLPDSDFVQCHSSENKKHLPETYVSDLQARLGAKLAQQQLGAQFVSLTQGRIFSFDRNRHCKPVEYNPNLPLIWSMDFNVAPMAGIIMQSDMDRVWVLDEVCIEDDAQTRGAVLEFAAKYKGEIGADSKSLRAVVAWGDRAGRDRDTRGHETDIDIMLKTLRENFHSVKDGQDYAQRFVVDGVNACNAIFDHDRCMIDPKCKRLMQDLEQMTWKQGTKEVEKLKNKALTHWGDAFRYPVVQMFELINFGHEDRSFGGMKFF